MKLRRATMFASIAVIFHVVLVANVQGQLRTSRLSQAETAQESSRPSRGSRRFSVAATDASPEKIQQERQPEDRSPIKRGKGNYRTVPRFEPLGAKIADTPVKNESILKDAKKIARELTTESTLEVSEVAIEVQALPRPTRQSRSRGFEDAAKGRRERIITDDEIDPIQRKVILDEENVTPSSSLRRRPFSRARQGSDDKKTNLETVSSQNVPVEKRKSGVRTSSFASRQVDEVANLRSLNDVTPRRPSFSRNAAKNINSAGVEQASELPKRAYQPTTRSSVRGSTHYKRPNKSKKDDASDVNEDDNYPEEFIKKIKKNSAVNAIRSSQLNNDLTEERRPGKNFKPTVSTQATESSSIESILEESSPIPFRRTSSRPLPVARRKTINSRVVNNGVPPTSSTPTASSTSRSRGELTPETQLRSRPSFRPRTSTSSSTSPTLSTEEYISSSIPIYSKQSASDDDNSLIPQEDDIESIPNISSSEKSTSRRPTYQTRQAYVPKSRVSSTSVRSNQIVVPIKPGFRARPPQPRFNPDTPRPLQPQISNRLRTFSAVTQEYVSDLSPTRSPATRRFQTPRSRRPSTTEPLIRDDKTFDDEEANYSPRPKSRESGGVKERVKFKPKETSTPFKYASELRRSYQKPDTDLEKKVDVKSLSQLGAGAPRHRFSSRYRGEGLKSSRVPAGGYVATLPSLVTSPAPFTTDFSHNTDLSTETLDIEESTIQDTTDSATSPIPTTDLAQTIANESTNIETDALNGINTIIAKPDVSNAVYNGKDSKYNNFWSSSTSTTEKVKFRFLTVNVSPGTSVQTPTQKASPSERSTTSTAVFRWKPVTEAINDTNSSEATTLPSIETPMTLANLIYKSKGAELSESEVPSNSNPSTGPQTNVGVLTKISTNAPKIEDTTTPMMTTTVTTTTTSAQPTPVSTTTTKKPTTTTTKKPTTTTTKKPTTTTTKKPTTTTTKKSTTTTTKKPTTTTTKKPTTTTTKKPTTTTTKKPTTTTTKKPTTTTTKKPVTTTKKPTTTSKKPAPAATTSTKAAPTTTRTTSTTNSSTKTPGTTTSEEMAAGTITENKPSDDRYVDDILLLNTLLQGGAGPSVSPRTGRTQNAQLVLANQIIELALMRAAASSPKPKISTTTENYRDFLQALVSSSQASFLEKARGPNQKELEDFVSSYTDEETRDVSTPDNLPKTATTNPKKSTTPNHGLSKDDDILAGLLDTQLAGTKSPKKAKPTKKPTTPAPSGLRYLLQAFAGARDNQPGAAGGLLRPPANASRKPQDDSSDSSEDGVGGRGEGGIPSSTDPGLLSAAINVTRAVSQFMGYVIQGAAESFQNYVRSRTGGFLTNYFNLGVGSPS